MQDEQAGPPRPEAGEPRVDAGPRPPEAGEPSVDAGPRRPETGEPRVDAAVAGLGELPELPVTEHAGVFEHVHRQLREVLGELDTGADGAPAVGEAPSRPGPGR